MLYDPSTATFTPTGSMTDPRTFLTLTLLNGGKVLALGGTSNPIGGNDSATFEIYDPSTGTWGSHTSTAQQHAMHSATLLPNGLVFIAGGEAGYPKVASTTELIDPVALTATAGPSLSDSRENHTAIFLNNANVLIAGGQDTAGFNSEVSSADLYYPSGSNLANLVSISVSPANPTLAVGSSQRFVATGTFSDGTTQQLAGVTWSSSTNAAVQISNDSSNPGVAIVAAHGTTTITATVGSVSGSTTLTVP